MSYNKNIDNYNKGEGHGAGNKPKPDTKYLKTLFKLLVAGLIVFYAYNYRAEISEYLYEIKFKAENALNSPTLSNTEIVDIPVVDSIIVEDLPSYEPIPTWITDAIESEEEGLISISPIPEQAQENPQIIDTPPSPIPTDEPVSNAEIVLEIFEGRDGKEGLRDKKTRKVYLEALYDIGTISSKNLSLWQVRLGKKFGWLEPDGTVIVPIEYDEIKYMLEYGSTNHNPNLVVRKGKKQGIIDLYSRKMVLPLEYTNIRGTGTMKNKEGKLVSKYYILSNEKGTGIYNIADKRLLIPLEYGSVSLTNADGFLVQNGKKYGAVNQQNEMIAPIKYTSLPIWNDYKDMVTFEIAEEAFECYDNKGYRVLTPADKRKLNGARLGVIVFNGADKKQGAQTSNGYIQIPAQYDYVFPVKTTKEVLYIVSINGKYGVVDKNNKPKIALSCDYISALNAEYNSSKGSKTMTHLRVYKNRKCGLISLEDMKTIIPIEYQNIALATKDFMWVKQNNKYGLMNSKNMILLPIDNPWIPKIELGASEDKCAIRMLEGKYKDKVFYNSQGEKITQLY